MSIGRLIAFAAVVLLMLPGMANAAVRVPADAAIRVPALQFSDRGAEVAIWQAAVDRVWRYAPFTGLAERRFVRRHGPLAVDGVVGPLTLEATKLYQRAAALPVTGIVTFRSWKRSMVLGNCCGGLPPAVLRDGDSSVFVTWLQIGLDRWMTATHAPPLLIPDGVFGPLTLRETLAYQTGAGSMPDGIVGPKTWSALGLKGYLNLP